MKLERSEHGNFCPKMGLKSITAGWKTKTLILVLLTLIVCVTSVLVVVHIFHLKSPEQRLKWPGGTAKLQDRDLLGKMWDRELFDNFVETRNMKPYSDKDRPLDMGYTSYNMSEVKLISHKGCSVRVGDVLQYRIQSKDFNGRNRITGGDFWYALLTSHKNPRASTAGYIADYDNGTYDAFVLAAWPGTVQFSLILVDIAEAVHHIKTFVWNSERRAFLLGTYQVKGKKTEGVCTWQRFGNWTGKCEYPAYNSDGGTVFLCDYKPGFPCDSMVAVRMDRINIGRVDARMRKGAELLFKSPYHWQSVTTVTNATVTVEGSELPPRELPRCRADQQIPRIQGYWLNGRWNSLLCRFTDWMDQSKLKTCLTNREVVILGDSTAAQIRDAIQGSLGKLPRKSSGTQLWTKVKYDTINATVYFQFHSYVFGSRTYRVMDWKSEADTLNGLNNADCNYIIMIGQWAHFAGWSRDSYIERMRLIRKAVIDLHRRCPDVPVVIKGPHPRHPKAAVGSVANPDCLHKEMEYLNREAFQGIGAYFMPIWDLSLSSLSRNNVHMPNYVIREELRMFMGYACDSIFS